MPRKVSIIGAAGTLGSCAAYAVATQGLCDELAMFDINENLLKQYLPIQAQDKITGIIIKYVKIRIFHRIVSFFDSMK